MNELTLGWVRQFYAAGGTPRSLCEQIGKTIDQHIDNPIWIYRLSEAELEPYFDRLTQVSDMALPLWGVPFAIKDNIDLCGVPTTAACPAFSYLPDESATVVQRLIEAGAIPIGKTNLDQFATGLNGTRSPFGAVANAFDSRYISGGSSSGSAVAVALDMVCFSLGTDTAGSGRVPAAFNNLVGLKPTLGLVPSSGVVPACRSLDCVSIFANDVDTASAVLSVAEGYDANDPFSGMTPDTNHAREEGYREGVITLGVIAPEQLEFFGDSDYEQAYQAVLERFESDATVELKRIDFVPFQETAALLYAGPWVAERTLACDLPLRSYPEQMHPVVRTIIEAGKAYSAIDTFSAQYQLRQLKRRCDQQMAACDALLTPTAGRCFTREELSQEPVEYNTHLGYYTNYMNLLDYAGLALPAGLTTRGLPFGVTVVAPRHGDRALLSMARRLCLGLGDQATPKHVGDPRYLDVLVCGAHMQGLPLNWQLLERGGYYLESVQTADCYRLLALPGGAIRRPALVIAPHGGATIGAELWRLPIATIGSFLRDIPAPLGLGEVTLNDGRRVKGFIAAAGGVDPEADDVTRFGDWRAYLNHIGSA
jgi:allophanate hydrolase